MKEPVKLMVPKGLRYPRITCIIHYNQTDTMTLRKNFYDRNICNETLTNIQNKINELRSSIRYIEVYAYNKDSLYFGTEYADNTEIDDTINIVIDTFNEIYEELSD